jgi:hypothetical protein
VPPPLVVKAISATKNEQFAPPAGGLPPEMP